MPEQGSEPTEAQVNRHAVAEGLKIAVPIGIGTEFAANYAVTSIVGEGRLEQAAQEHDSPVLTTGETTLILGSIAAGPIIGYAVYKRMSSYIRRNGGSRLIGYRQSEDQQRSE